MSTNMQMGQRCVPCLHERITTVDLLVNAAWSLYMEAREANLSKDQVPGEKTPLAIMDAALRCMVAVAHVGDFIAWCRHSGMNAGDMTDASEVVEAASVWCGQGCEQAWPCPFCGSHMERIDVAEDKANDVECFHGLHCIAKGHTVPDDIERLEIPHVCAPPSVKEMTDALAEAMPAFALSPVTSRTGSLMPSGDMECSTGSSPSSASSSPSQPAARASG